MRTRIESKTLEFVASSNGIWVGHIDTTHMEPTDRLYSLYVESFNEQNAIGVFENQSEPDNVVGKLLLDNLNDYYPNVSGYKLARKYKTAIEYLDLLQRERALRRALNKNSLHV